MSALTARQGIQLVPPSLRKRFAPAGGVAIPAAPGEWLAIFREAESVPVVAFDSEGNALIMHEEWGALVLANAHSDFVRIDHVSSPISSAVERTAA